jgi:hypothetical protein
MINLACRNSINLKLARNHLVNIKPETTLNHQGINAPKPQTPTKLCIPLGINSSSSTNLKSVNTTKSSSSSSSSRHNSIHNNHK